MCDCSPNVKEPNLCPDCQGVTFAVRYADGTVKAHCVECRWVQSS